MIPGDLAVRAVWLPREEGWTHAVPKIREFLLGLAGVHADLASWSQPVGSGARARLEEVSLTEDSLRTLIGKGLRPLGGARRDERIGASFMIFAGRERKSRLSMRARVGVMENPSGFMNYCAITIPDSEPQLREETVVEGIMAVAVQALSPNWVAVSAEEHLRNATNWWGLAAGWKIWLSTPEARCVRLPDPVERRDLLGGTLISCVRDEFDARNAAHTGLSDRVQDALLAAGLVPLRPESER